MSSNPVKIFQNYCSLLWSFQEYYFEQSPVTFIYRDRFKSKKTAVSVLFQPVLSVLDELPFARTDDGRIRCLRCDKTFTVLANARRHFKEKHATVSENIFECHLCSAKFRVQRYFNEHLVKRHDISHKMLKNAFV
jgi:hypothetical protein